jgi:hypothetical protein
MTTTVTEFDVTTKKISFFHVMEDDREFQVKCVNNIHEFAPAADDCACGKFTIMSNGHIEEKQK